MDVERIRELRLAEPFKPFRLILADGRKLLVDKAYYLAISRNGRHMTWSSLDGGWERVDPGKVAEAVVVTGRGRNGSGASKRGRQ